MIRLYKYQAGERSFVMIDGRDVEIPRFRKAEGVHTLCLLNSADGVAIIDRSASADFRLSFQGKDGCCRTSAMADVPDSTLARTSAMADVPDSTLARTSAMADVPGRTLAKTPPEAIACAVAFADLLGVKPFHTQDYTLEIDGELFCARIESHLGENKDVSLGAQPSLSGAQPPLSGYRLISVLCQGPLD